VLCGGNSWIFDSILSLNLLVSIGNIKKSYLSSLKEITRCDVVFCKHDPTRSALTTLRLSFFEVLQLVLRNHEKSFILDFHDPFLGLNIINEGLTTIGLFSWQ